MTNKQHLALSKFERKSSALLPLPEFAKRMAAYFMFAGMLIAISLGIGTLGYHQFASISWVDSFYNAAMILTGMGPVNQMATMGAKMFSSFYALFSGVAFLSTVAVLFAPIAHRIMHLFHLQENGN